MQVGRKILQLHFSSRLCYNAATERGEPFNESEGMAAVWRGDARLEDVELEPAGGVGAYLEELEALRKGMENRIPWDATSFLGHYSYLTPATWQPKIGPGVTRENLGERGRYSFYFMGEATITPNGYVALNSYHFRAPLNAAYEEGSFNRVRIYASLKFEGPAFYAGDTRPNRVLCDRVIVVKK